MLLKNINRKAIALFTAVLVWYFVNQYITDTKTIPNVPIKVINLPSDKTIKGLMPNGYLSDRLTLSVSGSKDVVRELDQGDLEIHIDASTAENQDWVVQVTRKNLFSLNPSLDLRHHVNAVTHPEYVLKLSHLVTEKVPIHISPLEGDSPKGYEFLDVWPQKLIQTISGPQEEVQQLKSKGLDVKIDLSKITKEELDHIHQGKKLGHNDEISYFIPNRWKKVPIPFKKNALHEINDPDAQKLRIDFLRKKLLPIGKEIPISIYYPQKSLDTINPVTYKLSESEHVYFNNDVALFSLPLYVKNVSRLFLDIIRENLAIIIIAAPKSEREFLEWSLEIIDTKEMEDTYVAYVIANHNDQGAGISDSTSREQVLRARFQNYMKKMALFTANGEKLNLIAVMEDGKIRIRSE